MVTMALLLLRYTLIIIIATADRFLDNVNQCTHAAGWSVGPGRSVWHCKPNVSNTKCVTHSLFSPDPFEITDSNHRGSVIKLAHGPRTV